MATGGDSPPTNPFSLSLSPPFPLQYLSLIKGSEQVARQVSPLFPPHPLPFPFLPFLPLMM